MHLGTPLNLPVFLCLPPRPTVTPQSIWSIMPRRNQTVVISQGELLLRVVIPSISLLVADLLTCQILPLGGSMKLQGHHWTVSIIRKFSLISSWSRPPYHPAPLNLAMPAGMSEQRIYLHLIPWRPCRQLPCLFKGILSGTRWWDTRLVLLRKVVKKRQHGGGEIHKDSVCVFLHSRLLRVASTRGEIMLPLHTFSWSEYNLTKTK